MHHTIIQESQVHSLSVVMEEQQRRQQQVGLGNSGNSERASVSLQLPNLMPETRMPVTSLRPDFRTRDGTAVRMGCTDVNFQCHRMPDASAGVRRSLVLSGDQRLSANRARRFGRMKFSG